MGLIIQDKVNKMHKRFRTSFWNNKLQDIIMLLEYIAVNLQDIEAFLFPLYAGY